MGVPDHLDIPEVSLIEVRVKLAKEFETFSYCRLTGNRARMKQSAINLDYEGIFRGLNQIQVEYIVVGGLAVNFHGIPRMTYDIDLMISLEPKNILKLVSTLTAWGYRPKAPVEPDELADEAKRRSWVEDKGMIGNNMNKLFPATVRTELVEVPPS